MGKRIYIAGSGGQGVLFLGKIIAYAAMIEKKEVTWFPSYGAEMRGGTAHCTVIISDEMIGSPVVRNPDILAVMNEASYKRFSERIVAQGLLAYDSSMISIRPPRKDIRLLKVPASGIAALSSAPKSANMVMLGALISVMSIISLDSTLEGLRVITPTRRSDSVAVNSTLLRKGYQLVEDTKG
jgi:2-oxoglutarate ferredoxin oxidoreductase subunit gamma